MSGMPPALQVAVLVAGVGVMIVAIVIPIRLALLFRRDAGTGEQPREGEPK